MRKNSQPNLADSFKRTALMKAVQQEQEECVAVLLEHSANPNLADADGNTALHLAVLSKNTAVAGLLLQHNAKNDAQNQVVELSQQLEMEPKTGMQLEAQTEDLKEELSTLHGMFEQLEVDKWQLREEVKKLYHHWKNVMLDGSQTEQRERDVEERAEQEIRQKLQEVNQFLQAQTAHQDTLEKIRSSHFDSLKNQLEDRIRDLERALGRTKSNQQERPFQKESRQPEVDKYKELYLQEVKTSKSLAKKLERAKERLEEANAKLLWERQRSKSAATISDVRRHLAAVPPLDSAGLGHLGNRLGLGRTPGLRTHPSHRW
ncbi:ankyrin repeat domain-containing protein 26-like isoform X1 [Myiozetetes cayanensis]|uniref:ankyrin repeat domain-containing protein 26-like isoform X1 n=1 Tax=Myiozetetes cayanensis TaxID=478635 RepID=UPI00215F0983|nr:ankyrin repeat domain-containing protein 26-like isoform X1 [Myiozetetes cayanensis]